MISLDTEEQRRVRILTRLVGHDLTIEEAAELLGVSVRHVWGMRARFLAVGPVAVAHGNRGRESPRRIDPELRARVVDLAGSDAYKGANDTFLAGLLAEHEGIELSRPSLGRILRAAGIAGCAQGAGADDVGGAVMVTDLRSARTSITAADGLRLDRVVRAEDPHPVVASEPGARPEGRVGQQPGAGPAWPHGPRRCVRLVTQASR